MKALLAALVVLLASAALAQGPVNYPPEVGTMTDAQFLQWARAYNQRRLAEWRALKEQAKADQPQYNIVQTTETRGSYDMGNVCGQGYRQQTTIIETDNPKYVNPGPLTIVNPFCPPRPSTAEELAEIKRTYKVAGGKVLTVRSADGHTLHIKVAQ